MAAVVDAGERVNEVHIEGLVSPIEDVVHLAQPPACRAGGAGRKGGRGGGSTGGALPRMHNWL